MIWVKVETVSVGEPPGKRCGHTCNAVQNGRFLYLFGGYDADRKRPTNQLHVFDTRKRTWSQPEMHGALPTPRDGHSCTFDGGYKLYLFGGSDGTNVMNDLYMLNTSTHLWINLITSGEVPLAREDHGAAFVGKRLFVFGGNGESPDKITNVCYNDLYILDTETFVWKRATTSGIPPRPRDSHTCSYWKKKFVVIGGGVAQPDIYLSDVHILDTDTLIWRELRTSGKLLPPRAGHSTVSFGKNLFVFGGFASAESLYNDLYMLDIDTGIWTEVATTHIGPSARYSAAGDRLDFMGGILVFFGGCNANKDVLDDMYYLYTGRLNIHPGKRTCLVEVTGSILDGYTIETIIDGKRFHGIVFRDKPNPLNPATNISSRRKRTFDETVSAFSNDMHRDNLTMSKVLKQSETGDVGASETFKCDSSDDSLGLPTRLLGLQLTKSPSLLALIQMSLSQEHDSRKASADPEPAAASLNRNDSEKNDKSKNDGANDNMTRSEVEVRTDDQTNVPISNNEAPRLERHDQKSDAPKPAAAEGGIAKDCTTRRVEDT